MIKKLKKRNFGNLLERDRNRIMGDNYDYIWNEIEKGEKEKYIDKYEDKVEKITYCKVCFSTNLKVYEDVVCTDCGLILSENRMVNSDIGNFNTKIKIKNVNCKSKISKLKDWNEWSNEEKNSYKLKEYIRTLCERLNIFQGNIPQIVEKCKDVIDAIKKYDGTKRARVKDGIIITCIYHIFKNSYNPYCYIALSNKIDLELKYVTKADKIISDLINMKKLDFIEYKIENQKKPYDYVITTIKQNNIEISNKILLKVKTLLDICEKEDILQDHTPLSIGCSCFYYILKYDNKLLVDLKSFSNLYNLSVVTIVKTYNKLLLHKEKFKKILDKIE